MERTRGLQRERERRERNSQLKPNRECVSMMEKERIPGLLFPCLAVDLVRQK